MGKPILYCSDCGTNLREEDFERGRAGHQDHRPYCIACRPDLKPVTPRSFARAAPVDRTPPSGLRRLPHARPASSTLPIALSAAGGGLLMIVLVVAASSPSKKPVAANPPVRFAASPAPPPAEPVAAPLRASPAPRPPEPEPPPPPPAPSLDRWLEEIRAIRKDDPEFRRAGEVRSMLRKAAEIAGPRKAEIDVLLAAYETELAKPATPAAAPFTLRVASFTLINADTDKPVAGFDPMTADGAVELKKIGVKKIDVRLNAPSSGVGSVEVVLNGKGRGENSSPYSCTNNSVAGGFEGWVPTAGRQTIKARIWSQKDRKGQAGPWVDFAFTIAD